jgi:imidazolonepropionase-like amidohydrolase
MALSYHVSAVLLPEGDTQRDLWIRDGQITFLPPPDFEELVPAGGFALCGLVDCHYHLTLDVSGEIGLPIGSSELVRAGLERHRAGGVLLIRDAGTVSDATQAVASNALPKVLSAGGLLAPAGGYFGFQRVAAADELVDHVRAQVAAGHRWVKIIADFAHEKPGHLGAGEPNYPPEVLSAAVAAAHVAGARIAVHSISRAGLQAAIDSGVDTIEHGCLLDERQLRTMAASGIAWTPTAVIAPHAERMMEGIGGRGAAENAREAFSHQRKMLPVAANLGVTLLAGTDMLAPASVWQEVALLQRCGIDPRVALAAASTTARAFLGEPALDEGAPPDLVWFAHDPRDDPEVLARPDLVMHGGVRIH